MNREAQILQALQGELPLAARKALVVELNSIRSQAEQRVAAAREVELGKEAAAAHLTPAPTYVRHTSDTDWLGKVGSVRQAPAEIHQQAKSEAGAWMRQVSALARADHEELRVQAVGYAQVWGSQFGELATVARDSFLQTASHLAGVKLAADDEDEPKDDDDSDEAYTEADDDSDGGNPFADDDDEEEGSKKEARRVVAARPLYEIARDIRRDWGSNVNYAAQPYLDAMRELDSINDRYYSDTAKSIVAYFLSNASSWRGETAKAIKAELKAMMSVRTAASPDFSSYPKGRAQGQEWSTTCSECGETETGTDYYNGWPSQDAFHRHLFCGPIPDGGYQDQDLAIDRYSSLRTAEWEAKSCARCGGNNSSGVDRCAHCGAVMDPSPKRKAGLYPDENAPGVTTWADGYGNWHATADSAEEAKAAIMKELKDRDAAGPGFRLKVVQVGPRHYTEDFPGREASLSLRTAEADGIDSPSPQSQNGYAESTLDDVSVSSAPEDTNMGWIAEGDSNAVTSSMGHFQAMFMGTQAGLYPDENAAGVTTWADGYGNWHATADSPEEARAAIMAELKGRDAAGPGFRLKVVQVGPRHYTEDFPGREGSRKVAGSPAPAGEYERVKAFVNDRWSGLYTSNYSRDTPNGRIWESTLHGPGGPLVFTLVHPDGSMMDMTRGGENDDGQGGIRQGSRKHAEADGIDSPSPQSQNGYAETTLTDVSVGSAPDDTNLGWIADGDPNAEDEASFEAPDNPIANEASRTAAGPAGFWCPKCKKYQSTRTPAQLKAAREHVPNCQGKKESSLDAHFARLVEAGDNDRPAGEAAYKPTGVDVSVNGYTYYNVTPEDIKTIYEHYRKTDPSASVTKVRGSRRTAAEVTRFDDGHSEWKCSRCKATVYRYRGESDVSCDRCGAEYNAAGQQLRDDWRGNMSNYDDEIGDMEGYEIQHANDDRDYSSQPGWNSAYGSINAHFASLVTAGKAYDKGMADGKIGDGIQYNPYPFDSQDGAEWIRGYRDAQGLQPGQKASSKTAGDNNRPAGAAPMVDQVTDDAEDDNDMFGGEWIYEGSRRQALHPDDDPSQGPGYLNDAPNLLGDPPGMDPEDYDMFAPELPKQARKTAMPAPADLGVSIGSIFYSSWGYDQTNVNFYEVVGLTGASVKVREVAKTFVEQNGPGGNKVIPQVGNYIGGETTKRLRDSGYADAAITINSSETAWLWDGKPKYETDSMYGH